MAIFFSSFFAFFPLFSPSWLVFASDSTGNLLSVIYSEICPPDHYVFIIILIIMTEDDNQRFKFVRFYEWFLLPLRCLK